MGFLILKINEVFGESKIQTRRIRRVWEESRNLGFNSPEFGGIKNRAGLNRLKGGK